MGRIILVSDCPIGASDRGAESCDQIIQAELDCCFLTCHEFNIILPKDYDLYLVSNFFFLSQESKDFLKTRKYRLICHDFLWTPSRDPGRYPNFLVDKDHLINLDFFAAAQTVFLQSNLQKRIFELNDIPGNLVSWGGNLWTDEILDKMVELGRGEKNGRAFVIDGVHKGVNESVEMCKNLFLPFDIIGRMPYKEFLETIAQFNSYVNCVNIVETFNRVLVECKVMNVLPVVNQWSGAIHEELYKYNGEELAGKLKEKRREIIGLLK